MSDRAEVKNSSLPGTGQEAVGLNPHYKPPVNRWRYVIISGLIGYEFGIVEDSPESLHIAINPPGQSWPEGLSKNPETSMTTTPDYPTFGVEADDRGPAVGHEFEPDPADPTAERCLRCLELERHPPGKRFTTASFSGRATVFLDGGVALTDEEILEALRYHAGHREPPTVRGTAYVLACPECGKPNETRCHHFNPRAAYPVALMPIATAKALMEKQIESASLDLANLNRMLRRIESDPKKLPGYVEK